MCRFNNDECLNSRAGANQRTSLQRIWLLAHRVHVQDVLTTPCPPEQQLHPDVQRFIIYPNPRRWPTWILGSTSSSSNSGSSSDRGSRSGCSMAEGQMSPPNKDTRTRPRPAGGASVSRWTDGEDSVSWGFTAVRRGPSRGSAAGLWHSGGGSGVCPRLGLSPQWAGNQTTAHLLARERPLLRDVWGVIRATQLWRGMITRWRIRDRQFLIIRRIITHFHNTSTQRHLQNKHASHTMWYMLIQWKQPKGIVHPKTKIHSSPQHDDGWCGGGGFRGKHEK